MRATDILTSIAASIEASHPNNPQAVEDSPLIARVAGVFVERENSKRADLLVKGLDLLVSLQNQFDGVNKPDNNFTNTDGNLLLLTSQKRKQEIETAKKKLDKVNEALGQALNAAQFGALEKLVKSGGKDEKDSE